jgi:starch synthase
MNVLLVSAEAVPFAKVGGLADVVGSLPYALQREGIDARVMMPGYGLIPHTDYDINYQFSFTFNRRTGSIEVNVYMCLYEGISFYFLQAPPFFGYDASVYTDWDWDMPRFVLFNQIAIAAAWEIGQRQSWMPDVFHVNDWHTSLIPFLLSISRWRQEWAAIASVISIHNIAYMGDYAGGWLFQAGIPGRGHPLLVQRAQTDNLLAIGITYADAFNTVSPTYATEIQYPHAGFELANLIRAKTRDLHGILNGLDTDRWNPATDKKIVSNFDVSDFEKQRPANKRHLQESLGLPISDDIPLIGVVSRLTWQKGFDMAFPALQQLMLERDVQFVGLGTGETGLEAQMSQLERDYPTKARAFVTYDGAVAQQIYAGCDIFLMPSHFEPCGIGQMVAMRYGALPLVRKTGGLADTVENYDNADADTGTGFVFEWEEVQAVLGTLRWALDTYTQRPDAWKRMQRRAMQRDFGWKKSAQEYIGMYETALARLRK